MIEPLVTVAIPIFNAEKTLELAIKSVLLQSYQNWELFLINDGSTDNSLLIAKQFHDNRIKIIDDGINKGLVNRLNLIPELSNGSFIARMDADDIMHPRRLEEQVKYMLANPEIDVSDCGIYTINENNEITGCRYDKKLPANKIDWVKKCYFTHPAIIAKKEWFEKNRYDEKFYRAEDYEIWLRTFDNSRFGKLNQYLLFYREGNVNIKNYLRSMNSVNKIYRIYGKGVLSSTAIYKAIIKSYLKGFLYILFSLFNLQNILVKFRSDKPLQNNIKEANVILGMINTSNIRSA